MLSLVAFLLVLISNTHILFSYVQSVDGNSNSKMLTPWYECLDKLNIKYTIYLRDIIIVVCYEIKETDLAEGNIVGISMDNQSNTQSSTIPLQITTDKQAYRLGEIVKIEIKNNGNQTLIFPDASLGLIIKNIDTGKTYGLLAAQVMTDLEPNEKKLLEWNQGDFEGEEEVETGNYDASVISGSISANTNFRIETKSS
jgi:hypothetical protein